MKILVLGSKGQLGRSLRDQLENSGHEVIYTSRARIDVAKFEITKNQISEISPEVVINATAYTAVDKAEEEKKTADLINHLAVKNIADICNHLECWLIHVSTDYVFDGTSNVSYKEDDKTNPQSVYGETKLKGELAIQASGCKYITLRTSWVFSEYGNNFLKTVLRLGVELDELSIVDDQFGCPTYAQDLAKAVVGIMRKLKSKGNIAGTYHFVGRIGCSWADFAEDIFKEAVNQNIIKNKPNISRVKSSEFTTLAKRPMQSQLNFSKFERTFGINQSNYAEGICSALAAYQKFKYKNRNNCCGAK